MIEQDVKVRRDYKDTLFRMIFREKENLLSLYNAMSGKSYTDPEQLNIVTLENAIYMNMKNDLAFVIDSCLHMYEHQSTICENMPTRDFFYVSKEYEKMIDKRSLYSKRRVKLPAPYFVVFYNGTDEEWEEKELKLSDSFEPQQDSPNLELVVRVININQGKSESLLQKCKPLHDYMQYVEKVRRNQTLMSLDEAVELAVNESIKEGILEELLTRFKLEAIQVSIFEFDEEREMKIIREDEREMAREEAQKEFSMDFVKYNLGKGVSNVEILEELTAIFHLEQKDAEDLVRTVQNS